MCVAPVRRALSHVKVLHNNNNSVRNYSKFNFNTHINRMSSVRMIICAPKGVLDLITFEVLVQKYTQNAAEIYVKSRLCLKRLKSSGQLK